MCGTELTIATCSAELIINRFDAKQTSGNCSGVLTNVVHRGLLTSVVTSRAKSGREYIIEKI